MKSFATQGNESHCDNNWCLSTRHTAHPPKGSTVLYMYNMYVPVCEHTVEALVLELHVKL